MAKRQSNKVTLKLQELLDVISEQRFPIENENTAKDTRKRMVSLIKSGHIMAGVEADGLVGVEIEDLSGKILVLAIEVEFSDDPLPDPTNFSDKNIIH